MTHNVGCSGPRRTPRSRRVLVLAGAIALGWSAPASAANKLVLTPDPVQLAILLAAFVLLILPVNALLFRPLFRVIDERDQRIEGTRARAAALEGESQALVARYESTIRETREAAELDRRQHIEAARAEQASVAAEARRETETEIERSREELGRSLVEARAALRDGTEDLARQAAERILGRALS